MMVINCVKLDEEDEHEDHDFMDATVVIDVMNNIKDGMNEGQTSRESSSPKAEPAETRSGLQSSESERTVMPDLDSARVALNRNTSRR